jgi:hypothetical protein
MPDPVTFDKPITPEEVLRILQAKEVLPTAEGSSSISSWGASQNEIGGHFVEDVRRYSFYSARTTNLRYLEELKKLAEEALQGKINMAQFTQQAQGWLHRLGYSTESGFAGHEGDVPPATKDAITDLASDKRLSLIYRMVVGHCQNTAFLAQGMAPDFLQAWPCLEYVRFGYRAHPRGTTEKPDDLSWKERFIRAGGRLADGRIVDTKDSPVWQEWCRNDIFPDGTDDWTMPWFNTGGGYREVSRKESVKLGVIDADESVKPKPVSLLGDWFKDPETLVLGDIKAGRAELYAAAQKFREAA